MDETEMKEAINDIFRVVDLLNKAEIYLNLAITNSIGYIIARPCDIVYSQSGLYSGWFFFLGLVQVDDETLLKRDEQEVF